MVANRRGCEGANVLPSLHATRYVPEICALDNPGTKVGYWDASTRNEAIHVED